MAKINLSLEILLGKYVVFIVPVESYFFPLFPDLSFLEKISGEIRGFSFIDGSYELLVGDDFYSLDDMIILSLK